MTIKTYSHKNVIYSCVINKVHPGQVYNYDHMITVKIEDTTLGTFFIQTNGNCCGSKMVYKIETWPNCDYSSFMEMVYRVCKRYFSASLITYITSSRQVIIMDLLRKYMWNELTTTRNKNSGNNITLWSKILN